MRVVAGVIMNRAGLILLAERPPSKHLAGFWEFPGGKIEVGESEEAALIRELQEELQLKIAIQKRLGEFAHQYEDLSLTLIAFQALALNEPVATESVQNFRWLDLDQINVAELAPADIAIFKTLAL